VHQKYPKFAKNIAEYCDKELIPYIKTLADTYSAKSIAIAWDQYHEHSIKAAREIRGDGLRQQDLPRKGLIFSR